MTVFLVLAYCFGVRLTRKTRAQPMWAPTLTPDTKEDTPDTDGVRKEKLSALILQFILVAAILGFTGYLIAETGIVISERSGIAPLS